MGSNIWTTKTGSEGGFEENNFKKIAIFDTFTEKHCLKDAAFSYEIHLFLMEDKRNILKEEEPFSWKLLKNGKGLIYWQQKLIKTIKEKECNKLKELIAVGNAYDIQLYLAKITGNFKHGNERQ